MTVATGSLLHVRKATRTSSPKYRRSAFKALMGGLAAVAIACVTVMGAIAGAGRVLAVSLQARSDMRSAITLAPPSDQLARAPPPPDGRANRLVVAASLSLPETGRSFETLWLDTKSMPAPLIAEASGMQDEPAADEIITGSLGTAPVKVAALDIGFSENPPARVVAPSPPLPRVRPKLAALPPAGDIGVKPEDDAPPARTAIYDITAQAVYLPSGERLEAHSGLGSLMDDPRYVHKKNRGATPPNIYQLRLRESLFHGVQAIRLTPLRGGDMFGRDGILAHSYMLGPNGQSNGCVSFKDYAKFLRAFQRGEFDRMIVVARLSKPPASFARRNVRSAANSF
jgi:hypothetical protein